MTVHLRSDTVWGRLVQIASGGDSAGPWKLAVQALSSTRAGYDLLAPDFDNTRFRTGDATLSKVASLIGPPKSIGRALDICCGTGAGVWMLAPLCRDQVVGLDLSGGMLEQAQSQARIRVPLARSGASIHFVQANAVELPFQDERFDVATCFGALLHIPKKDKRRFIDSIARCLVPGGRFVTLVADPSQASSADQLVATAFDTAMQLRNLLPGPKFHIQYQSFLLPEAMALFEEAGFSVSVHRNCYPDLPALCVLVATLGSKQTSSPEPQHP